VRTRKRPPTHVQADVLIEQNNMCLYCGHPFGDLIVRNGNDWVWLSINWDHFVPFALSNRNPDDGWVAACQLCNSYKGSLVFSDVRDVRTHILERAIANRHDPLPFWNTPDLPDKPIDVVSGAVPAQSIDDDDEPDEPDDAVSIADVSPPMRRGRDFVDAALARRTDVENLATDYVTTWRGALDRQQEQAQRARTHHRRNETGRFS